MKWARLAPIIAGVAIIAGVVWSLLPHDLNDAVLHAAYEIPDGGGFCPLSGSGVAQDIVFKSTRILSASKQGRYCCGYTFEVFMHVADRAKLLEDRQAWEIARAQQEWYAIPKYARRGQMVEALQRLELGREVPLEKAKAGDFVVFSRYGSGHAAILLGVVRRGNEIVGLKYRSSQPGTRGVGDEVEYILESGIDGGTIKRDTIVVGRLTG